MHPCAANSKPFSDRRVRAVRRAAGAIANVSKALTVNATVALVVAAGALLAGCTSIGLGISIPIPGVGSVNVGVDNHGRVGGGVSVGTGGVSVGVGGTAQLPGTGAPHQPESAASAPQ